MVNWRFRLLGIQWGVPIRFIFAFLGIHGFQTLPPDFWTTKNSQKKNMNHLSWEQLMVHGKYVVFLSLAAWFICSMMVYQYNKKPPKKNTSATSYHIWHILCHLTWYLFFWGATQTHHVITSLTKATPGPSDPSPEATNPQHPSDGESDRGTEASLINTLPPLFCFFFPENFVGWFTCCGCWTGC